MADLDDIELLESGALDLTGSDFRNADLRNRDLNGRNFTRCKMDGAKLEGAILTGCVFDHAKLTSIVAHQADLSSSTFMGSIVRADFTRSNLRNCVFLQCHLAGVNFNFTDLSGAKFPHTVFGEDNIFSEAQSDAITDFEGVQIERAASRLPLFRFFEYSSGGVLKRKERRL